MNLKTVLAIILFFVLGTSIASHAMGNEELLPMLKAFAGSLQCKKGTAALESLIEFGIKEKVCSPKNIIYKNPELMLKNIRLGYKDFITSSIDFYKSLPVEIRKAVHQVTKAAQSALKKTKLEMQNTIKMNEAIIADHEKKQNQLKALNAKKEKSKKDKQDIVTLEQDIAAKQKSHNAAVENVTKLKQKFQKMEFAETEKVINEINSIAYWNSGSGFFEQFKHLNWSGKFLTITGVPLAGYGLWKLYNDYCNSSADEEISQESLA